MCPPCLAIRVLNQLENDSSVRFPAAAQIIQDNTYIDEFLAGDESEDTAIECRDQLISKCNLLDSISDVFRRSIRSIRRI